MTEITIKQASVIPVSQAALRHADYVLTGIMEKENDADKKALLKEMIDALWPITNYFGVDAIGSKEVLIEYYPKAFK